VTYGWIVLVVHVTSDADTNLLIVFLEIVF